MTGSPTAPATPPQAPLDVQVLRTAAALENLAVASYTAAAALPFLARGNERLRALLDRNTAHHRAHARAFNEALVGAGAAAQNTADARYAATVRLRLARITDPASLADLLTQLENVNAQSCTRFASLPGGGTLRSLLVNVASVEAQHGSELLVLRALLDGGQAQPGAVDAAARVVPASVGAVGIPYAAYPTDDASAVDEGAAR